MIPKLLLPLFFIPLVLNAQIIKFAAIGDYGYSGSNELAVANLVKSWNPQFVITFGDNNYDLGEQATIDQNIGQYYHKFIYPYIGSYGAGDTVNNFFPALGNHDWYTSNAMPYLNYFTLPGNERYYDFIKGNVHFFSIDSDPNEPDGTDSSSVQALWLKNALANSTQRFNIVYFHHAAYSSSEHGNTDYMQWPFKKWGADAVMAGHDHSYERIFYNNITYFVNGLGGRSIYTFNTPVPGSQVRYNNNYGAMLMNSYADSLVFQFYSISGNQRDYFRMLPAPKVLSVTALVEGFYKPLTNLMTPDTAKIYLRNISSPYAFIDSSKNYLDASGKGSFVFNKASNATNYYLVFKHRNSLETWSAAGNHFTANETDYNFTSDSGKAYGYNLKLKGTKYCIYSGEVINDGLIDVSDLVTVHNDALTLQTGYKITDVTGDSTVDVEDIVVVYNNLIEQIVLIRP